MDDFTNFTSFHFGHCFQTKQDAMADYDQRLAGVWEHYADQAAGRHTHATKLPREPGSKIFRELMLPFRRPFQANIFMAAIHAFKKTLEGRLLKICPQAM